VRFLYRLTLVLLIGAVALAGQAPSQPPTPQEPQGRPEQGRGTTQAQQRPVFRGGTHFVRVDAYPVQDGKIIAGLTAADFEISEDGAPQTIESFDFVTFDTFTPEAVRRNPSSQREGFDMAADPRYRVFVLFVDIGGSDLRYIQQPLISFLDRVLGPNDLFGMLTSRNSAKDLVLGQKSDVTRATIEDLWRSSLIDRDEADDLLDPCGNDGLAVKARFRLDQIYTALESTVAQLGSLRQERKNVIFVSDALFSPRPDPGILERRRPPLPKAGIVGGRVGVGDSQQPRGNEAMCASEVQRLAMMDFDVRFRQLLKTARQQNVTFYAITPGGLQAPLGGRGMSAVNAANDSVMTLAHETDGIAIVNTNDLTGGMKQIADDLAAYYVLGYYTTNTKFDGGLRRIKVRLKPRGTAIRARREYRAPTEAEIAALSAPAPSTGAAARPAGPSPVQVALAALDPGATSQQADVAAGALIGEPSVFRVAPRMPPQRAGLLHFERADRIRIDWPILGPTDGRVLRLLDRAGRPLPVDLPLMEDPASRGLSVAFPLAAFSRADYILELTVTAGSITERRLLALRVK
jgi:VWFA-related protein